MTSRTLVRPGRPPKNLIPLKQEIFRALDTGPKRWIDLEKNESIFSIAKSTGPLSKALKEMAQEGILEKGYIPDNKKHLYFLTEAAEALRTLDQLESMFSQFREALSSDERFSNEHRVSENEVEKIQSIIIKTQLVFLKTLDIISDTNPAVQAYFQSWFTSEVINTMIAIYSSIKNRLPRTTQRATLRVTQRMEAQATTTSTSRIEEIEKIDIILQSIVDFLYETSSPN